MAAKRIMLLIAITVLLIASTTVPALALLQNGNPAPNFQLTDLAGNIHTLSDYRGKVVVIEFFGYACGYCISDAKTSLVPLYNTYYKNDTKVQFLGVEVSGVSNAYIQQFVQETGVPWPVGSGGSSVGPAYQVTETPTLYVIDPAGNVALTMLYPTNVQTLKSTIDALEGSSTPAPAPAVCAQGPNSLDVFVKGTDGALWWKHWDGTAWSASTSLGGVLTSSPAATSPGTGQVNVFVRGTDGALYEKTTANGGTSWSSWYRIGGQLLAGTGPAACNWGSAWTGWFVTGTDNNLYHMSVVNGKQSGWENLGGYLTSSPAAASPGSGRVNVFVRGSDGAVYQRYWPNAGSWSNWTSLGGQIPAGTGPAASSWGSGRLDLLVQGMNGALYHKSYSGSTWSSWENLGGYLTASPAAATAPGSKIIDVFVRGSDNGLWQKTYNNGGWGTWQSFAM